MSENQIPAESTTTRESAPAAAMRLPAWKKSLFACLTICVLLGIAELLLALLAPQKTWARAAVAGGGPLPAKCPWATYPNAEVTIFDPDFGAYTNHTNSDGIMDRVEHAVARSPGTIRVLLLGDSFTEGYGLPYDKTWGRGLEQALQQRFGADVIEIIKAGVHGFNAADYVAAFETKWQAYKPDVVLLGMAFNDYTDNPPYDPGPLTPRQLALDGGGRAWLGGLISDFHVLIGMRRKLLAVDGIFLSRALKTAHPQYIQIASPSPRAALDRYANTLKYLQRLGDDCRGIDAELLVMFVPQRSLLLLLRQPVAGFDPSAATQHLRRELDGMNIASFDVLPAIAPYSSAEVFFPNDGHFNDLGYAILGREALLNLLTRTRAFSKLQAGN